MWQVIKKQIILTIMNSCNTVLYWNKEEKNRRESQLVLELSMTANVTYYELFM